MRVAEGERLGFGIPHNDAWQGGKVGQDFVQLAVWLADADDPVRFCQAGQGFGEGNGSKIYVLPPLSHTCDAGCIQPS